MRLLMTLEILQEKRQIDAARQEMVARGISTMASPLYGVLRRFGLVSGIAIGDRVKSWDILTTINFLERNANKGDPILDIGCYASEILLALHKLGYSNLTGVDLNPNLQKMPFADRIRFEQANFLKTPFKDASFKIITSISVIEHGYDGAALFKEMSRLLQPGGVFIASFDYWQEKVDTAGIKFFDMDWIIFSEIDVQKMIKNAAEEGLYPAGDIQFGGRDKTIHCGGKDYTFGWLALKKK
jgi:SAM-dependent methyltransferase